MLRIWLVKGIIGALVVLVIFIGVQVLRIWFFSTRFSYNQIPFERKLSQPRLRILFLGDSTAVGTGARDSRGSVAGYFGQDFPKAEIVNISRNGKRLHELAGEFPL